MLVGVEDGERIARERERELVLLAHRPELTVTWSRYGPGGRGPELHVHREHTDAFYVLTGELTFLVGPRAEPLRAPAGTFVAVPPGVVHTFANASEADATWLNMHAPDMGFAAFLRAGAGAPWDSFAPPADGGLPADRALVQPPGGPVAAALPGLSVVEWPADGPATADADAIVFAAPGRRVVISADR